MYVPLSQDSLEKMVVAAFILGDQLGCSLFTFIHGKDV